MKTNISSLAIAVVAMLVSGCNTTPVRITKNPPAAVTARPPTVTVGAPPAPVLTAPTPSPGGVTTHVIAPTPVVTNGLPGGVDCLFVNKTEQVITVVGESKDSDATFILELPAKKIIINSSGQKEEVYTYRVFPIMPENWKYWWKAGKDQRLEGPAAAKVAGGLIHAYDGIGFNKTESFGLVRIFE